jgi:hypothetical protein
MSSLHVFRSSNDAEQVSDAISQQPAAEIKLASPAAVPEFCLDFCDLDPATC